jgi:hypothetical protein
MYRISQEHDNKKSKYILDTIEPAIDALVFVRHRKIKLKGTGGYINSLNLRKVPKSQWRACIVAFQKEMRKRVIAATKSYDRVEVSQEWLKAQRKKNSRDFSVMKIAEMQDRRNPFQFGLGIKEFKKSPAELEENGRALYIVGNSLERQKLQMIKGIFFMLTNIRYSQRDEILLHYEVAPTNVRKFKNVKNLMTVEKFTEGNSPVFRKMMSLIRLHKQMPTEFEKVDAFLNTFNTEILKRVSPGFLKDCQEFERMFDDFSRLISFDNDYGRKFIQEECYKTAEVFDLFDLKYEERLKKVLLLVSKLPNLSVFVQNDKVKYDAIADMIKEMLFFKNQFGTKEDRFPIDLHYTINMREKYVKPVKKVAPLKPIGAKELLAELPEEIN